METPPGWKDLDDGFPLPRAFAFFDLLITFYFQFMGLKETIKSCKTLFLVLTMMIVCWTPYTVVILMDFKDVLSMEVEVKRLSFRYEKLLN